VVTGADNAAHRDSRDGQRGGTEEPRDSGDGQREPGVSLRTHIATATNMRACSATCLQWNANRPEEFPFQAGFHLAQDARNVLHLRKSRCLCLTSQVSNLFYIHCVVTGH
jgi:hypothetical protein